MNKNRGISGIENKKESKMTPQEKLYMLKQKFSNNQVDKELKNLLKEQKIENNISFNQIQSANTSMLTYNNTKGFSTNREYLFEPN